MPFDQYDSLPERTQTQADSSGGERPYIGILFECCGVYVRVYRRADQACYHARCPKCFRTTRVRVGRDGVSARLFRAS